ncbi:10238_t:CDS:1 [Cetraspora pellucida]|uniref:10238_t:CDS:1 n=1 Tax=Cetraspora pellucida TaxID=1433469 RepID=A0A9N8W531_9GLOM|nr:10238_t:CDS:1 [Cetraspora pellucida]
MQKLRTRKPKKRVNKISTVPKYNKDNKLTTNNKRIRWSSRVQQVSNDAVDPPFLPDDVINIIFEYLPFSSRFNCLVNRSWCRLMIPILWRSPFKWISKRGLNDKYIYLIRTYLSCLDPVTKANLRQAGIKLPRNPKQPLFRYHQYLKEFNFRDIQTCIRIWYDNTQIIDPALKDYWSRFRNKDIRSTEIFEIGNKIMYLMTEITRLLFNSTCLKEFAFGGNPKFKLSFETFPEYRLVAENVTSLSLDPIFTEFYDNWEALLNPFTNIKRLYVPFYHLEKTRFRDDMNIFVRHLSPRALMVLTWLGLSNFRLCLESLEVLSNCPNLETLVFWNCTKKTNVQNQLLPITQFLSVKSLFIFYSNHDFKPIFQMTEKTLKEIVLDNSSENTKVILDAMILHSPNITRLALHVNKMDILSEKFNKWMELSKLESLILKSKDAKFKSFIQVLVTHFPESLTDLDLDIAITSTLLRKILNICNVNFKKLGLNDKCGITDDHLRILTKYAEHYKSLEEVRFDRWAVIYKNQETKIKLESGEFSKLSKAVLEKAGRFIKFIRRDSYDPFFNPMYSY